LALNLDPLDLSSWVARITGLSPADTMYFQTPFITWSIIFNFILCKS
jgi:hypothetical protein